MKKALAITACTLALAALAANVQSAQKKAAKGEDLFKLHCAVCHPNGGNIINPKKTLKKADLAANGFKTVNDIVKNMRKPGPGMTPFDAKTIPDKDAKAIADYVLKTFK